MGWRHITDRSVSGAKGESTMSWLCLVLFLFLFTQPRLNCPLSNRFASKSVLTLHIQCVHSLTKDTPASPANTFQRRQREAAAIKAWITPLYPVPLMFTLLEKRLSRSAR